MPGNDRNGGFASHVVVPARFVCPVPASALAQHELWELSVVSDAASTPFEAVKRSGLAAGELAILVGVGGIGVYGVQIAAATGAKVIAIDIDDRKLEQARAAGAHAAINVKDMPAKDVRKRVRSEAEAIGAPPHLWKIFEMSGTRAGQETAFSLLGFGASLAVVGFTTDRVEVGLSNLMAYDAVVRGNWGADPLIYPELLDMGRRRPACGEAVHREAPALEDQRSVRGGPPGPVAQARRARAVDLADGRRQSGYGFRLQPASSFASRSSFSASA